MGLLNYTTQIQSEKSIGEIQAILGKAGVKAILCEYDGLGGVSALTFRVPTAFGDMAFRLPADPQPVLDVLNKQAMTSKIPRRYKGDIAQARRVAWRIVKDWVEAQLALIETRMAKVEQAFLPYAVDPSSNETLYQKLQNSKFRGLALPEKTE